MPGLKQKEWMQTLRNLTWLTQVGLSVATPLLLCLLAAWWACGHWGAPSWIYLPALVLGLGAGAASFAGFARQMTAHARRTQKRPPDRP